MIPSLAGLQERIQQSVSRQRVLETAWQLVAAPSPTGEAGPAADRLADLLQADGFLVERPAAGYPAAPAVVARLETGRPGRTLQLDGHLDTVHLPFVPPRVDGSCLTGSGAADMKGGIAALVEALRILRDTGALGRGAILLTAHDLHEAPWGLGQQLDQMIADGWVGNGVLIPEGIRDWLPVIGRGNATWKAVLRRVGPPVHEVHRPPDEPSVIAAGAELIARLARLQERLELQRDPQAGCSSVFVGQIHSGEIYNQLPQECLVEGTRRWLPGESGEAAAREFQDLLDELAGQTGTKIELHWTPIRDAFALDLADPLVSAFQRAHEALSGQPLATGPKLFVDDGNSFFGRAGLAAITHGPRAGGAHTLAEWVEVDDLARVAVLFALTAVLYCNHELAPQPPG